MRNAIELRRPPGSAPIEQIRLDAKPHDDIPALPAGLRATYADKAPRTELFRLPDEHILPSSCRDTGRPGMDSVGGIRFRRRNERVGYRRVVRTYRAHRPRLRDIRRSH